MFFTASLACAKQLYLMEDVQSLIAGGIKNVHIDIMDGHNVPNFAMSFDVIEQLKQSFPDLTVDAHFMTENPENYVERSKRSGVDWMIFDYRETDAPKELLRKIRAVGMLAGIVLNPESEIKELEELLPFCDVVLVMGVKPGASGQPFLPETLHKISTLAKLRSVKGEKFLIVVDGGINYENAHQCINCGADGLVLGALAIFNQDIAIAEASRRFAQRYGNIGFESNK